MSKGLFGLIIANRGFFPAELARDGRRNLIDVLEKNGYESIVLSEEDSKYGSVETFKDAQKCTELFKKNADKIDGIIVSHPNFGEEKGILEAIRLSHLDVPILIQAEPDDINKMSIKYRRDSFCGKISDCNNLRQAGISFSLTRNHTVSVSSKEFIDELDRFVRICKIVRGLKYVRLGAIGARPAAFNTVRYSEKILESYNIAVQTVDLSEILYNANRIKDDDRLVKEKLSQVKNYFKTCSVDESALLKMAKFGIIIDKWAKENEVHAVVIQCWTSLEENYGIVPCTIMSMLSESLLPAACEVDVTGVLSMLVLQLASNNPSAIMDWNNNYGADANKCILFHCSNIAKSFLENAEMKYQQIIAGTVGKDNTFGTVEGKIKPAKSTFLRLTTNDVSGCIRGYVGEGEFTNDALDTFGGYGVYKINNLQNLMQFICEYGFEHHVAINIGHYSDVISEALNKYMKWDIYQHI
jgi:L-fucose isomerase-like protein